MDQSRIRNLCIIAHIDHGKSTLADRLLLRTGAITQREFREQLLDDMDLERERGITIKASAVRMDYAAQDGTKYLLNLIDTPGHVDFSYEVVKSLRACEGALLVVDASQGVEAQTVANYYQARDIGLTVIPVINKIDLPTAHIEQVKEEIMTTLGILQEPILVSAKEGKGVDELLERIVRDLPPPGGSPDAPLQALVFDSKFDIYKGVVVYVRLMNGTLAVGDSITLMRAGKDHEVLELGVFVPKAQTIGKLSCGEVGYLTCNIKEPKEVHAGETITHSKNPAAEPLPGYRAVRPMVFSGIYPVNPADFDQLRDCMPKLQLSDASFEFQLENSNSFGMGYRCGFLGLLHLEIIQERLEREFGLNLVATTPSVVYQVLLRGGEIVEVDNPTKMPDPGQIEQIEEPTIKAFLITPSEYLGAVMQLALGKRGIYKSTEYLGPERAMLIYEFPLSEILVDFHDKLKSVTRGYGSFDYEFLGYRPAELVKLEILLNGSPCDPLAAIVPKEKAYQKGKELVEKLKEVIPQQLYEVAIQAAVGSRIIARETVRPVGKNVTAKCYGGDITRKRKLWEKQKMGKKRMKTFGKVEIPQEAFMAILKI
ncbi:MAG: translation elongation factor 4 [Candidatus Omnitrophica bacterium]|nr:translation elongation factor 4 [Candidatus Omnitrophota bacterium]